MRAFQSKLSHCVEPDSAMGSSALSMVMLSYSPADAARTGPDQGWRAASTVVGGADQILPMGTILPPSTL